MTKMHGGGGGGGSAGGQQYSRSGSQGGQSGPRVEEVD